MGGSRYACASSCFKVQVGIMESLFQLIGRDVSFDNFGFSGKSVENGIEVEVRDGDGFLSSDGSFAL